MKLKVIMLFRKQCAFVFVSPQKHFIHCANEHIHLHRNRLIESLVG